MNVYFNQLPKTLDAAKPCPIVLLSGDESQLLEEAYQLVLKKMAAKDFSVDQKWVVSASTDWQAITQSVTNGSLFLEKRLFVLRLENATFSKDLTQFIECFVQQPAGQNVLLICMPKIAKKDQSTACYKAIDKVGLVTQLWPLKSHELRSWLQNHCAAMGLSYEPTVLSLIEDATEGNLSAAKQCLDKLQLVFGSTHITASAAREHVFSQTQYQVFELMTYCLSGNMKKVIKLFNHYRQTESQMNLLLWLVARDLQLLYQLAQHQSRDAIYKKYKIWPSRKQPYEMALRRVNVQLLAQWLDYAAQLDRCIKSMDMDMLWDGLFMLLVAIVQAQPVCLEDL